MVEQSNKSETKSLTYFIFVRHGDRNPDDTVYQSQIENDDAISASGLEQTSKAGAYLSRRLKEVQTEYGIEFDEIRVESSPFLRTLQTAAKAA